MLYEPVGRLLLEHLVVLVEHPPRGVDHADVVVAVAAVHRAVEGKSEVIVGIGGGSAMDTAKAAAALAVKLTSPGPVIFSQERIGINRRSGDRRRSRCRALQRQPRHAAAFLRCRARGQHALLVRQDR